MKEALEEMGKRFLSDTEFREAIIGHNGKIDNQGKLLLLMAKDYYDKKYTAIPKAVIIVVAGAASLLVLGKKIPGEFDEKIVITLALAALGSDLNDYKLWREAQGLDDLGYRVTINGVKVHLSDDDLTDYAKENLKEAAYGKISGVTS